MIPASRTPEGHSHRCPVCGHHVAVESSASTFDAPCPCCGCLIWFDACTATDLDFLVSDAYLPDLGACLKREALWRMVEALVAAGKIPASARDAVVKRLMDREELGSTGIGRGFAIPHAHCDELDETVGCVARSIAGIDYGSLGGEKVHLLVLILSPSQQRGDHLRKMERVSRWLRTQQAGED